MKKIKVSHEVPFCLLSESLKFNDYDYCLPHLLDEDEEYRTFFNNVKSIGRYIVMDNSLHELGEAYAEDRLLHWINELEPNEFIVPDVWEDMKESFNNAHSWYFKELPKSVLKVAVVQAKSLAEATLCVLNYKKLGYKKIAFSYGASYYNDICPHPNKDFGKAMGRFMVINKLYQDKVLTSTDRVHLLGTSWPAEFGMYKNIKCIESIDTSNPIMAAIEEKGYNHMGLIHKPTANMNNYQDEKIDFINTDLVNYNVDMFKVINEL